MPNRVSNLHRESSTAPSSAAKKNFRNSSAKAPEVVRQDWQVQTAKAQFSEVFRRARTEGPQRITRQGKEGVVMISDEHYHQLVAKSRQPKSIVQFFRESPLVGVALDMERDRDTGRKVEL